MNNKRDFAIAREKHWYRVPVKSAPRNLRELSVKQIAFYFTKAFENEAYSVRWSGNIKRITIVRRRDLLPDEILDPRSGEDYFKIELGELERLSTPILSRRQRRVVFIQTTPSRLQNAKELNDLYHESPVEEELWQALKSEDIPAERQFFIDDKEGRFALDFAIFCNERSIDVECDGDKYHLQTHRVKRDKKRNNVLESLGWSVLRYSSSDIFVRLPETLRQVKETITRYGGLKP